MSEQRFWSVTTLIGSGSPKPALVGWAARVTAERAWDKAKTLDGFREDNDRDGAVTWLTKARWDTTKNAAHRGTSVHTILEAYALGQKPQVPPEFEPWHRQIVRFLEEQQPEFEASEAPVYNLDYGYAGTLDMILNVEGARCVADAKTTDKGPEARSRPPYGEVALQLCAYSRADLLGISPAVMRSHNGRRYYIYDPDIENAYEPMPDIQGAFALVISPVDYQFVPVRIDEEVWNSFLAVREVADWTEDVSRRVFGPTVTAKAKAA